MSDHLDGDLEPRAEAKFARHIARCRRCTRMLAALRSTVDDLNVLRQHSPADHPSVVDQVIVRITSDGGIVDGRQS